MVAYQFKKKGNHTDICDLRSAIKVLAESPGQIITTREQVDPDTELAAVYKQIGAGTTLPPPTKTGPAMLFENIKGFNPALRDYGITCKTIFDCTVPFEMKSRFKRSQFKDVDIERFLSNLV